MWLLKTAYTRSGSCREAITSATYAIAGTPGNTSSRRHSPPPSPLTCTSPSSVPTYSSPSTSGDSSNATIVPNGDVNTFFHTASGGQIRPITGRWLRSSPRLRSPLTAVHVSARSSDRNSFCAANQIRRESCGLMSSGESQCQRSAPSPASGCGWMSSSSPLARS